MYINSQLGKKSQLHNINSQSWDKMLQLCNINSWLWGKKLQLQDKYIYNIYSYVVEISLAETFKWGHFNITFFKLNETRQWVVFVPTTLSLTPMSYVHTVPLNSNIFKQDMFDFRTFFLRLTNKWSLQLPIYYHANCMSKSSHTDLFETITPGVHKGFKNMREYVCINNINMQIKLRMYYHANDL